MNFVGFAVTGLLALAACSSSSSSAPDAPVIDSLDVPSTTSPLTVNGQTGPGVVLTLTAHDQGAGITAFHYVLPEANADDSVAIPGSPTTISGQKIELVFLGAPSGAHQVSFYLTNAEGTKSNSQTYTVTVP
jgi:hypothetical protein